MTKETIVVVRHTKTGKVEFYQFPSKKNAVEFTKDLDKENEKKEIYQYLIQQ